MDATVPDFTARNAGHAHCHWNSDPGDSVKSRNLVAVVALAVALTDLGAGSPAGAAPSAGGPTAVRTAPEQAPAARGTAERARFRPRPGVTFNSPGQFVINDKVLRAIRHSFKRSKIRAMTWNFNSWVFVRALREAHQRGVSVRIIISRRLAREQGPGGPFRTLQRALDRGNKRRPKRYRSWARTCYHSCRGRGGAMHSKMYVFSKVGAQRHVVMSSSANMTGSAGAAQYNDMFTITGRRGPYRGSIKVFNQAAKDRRAPVVSYKSGSFTGWFQPRRSQPDRVMRMLNKVRCKGARGAGINGRTSIRIAQDVMLGDRGVRIATKLRSLHRHGCNIRLVYSQLGGRIWKLTRNIPRNHLVRDRDGDGAYDIYLHMKAMAISGHYGSKRGARVVYQGSENWSGIANLSDEQGLIIRREGVERKYGRRINRLFGIHLVSARPLFAPVPQVDDPYMNMEG
jgi:phosphatidylserine/phosphatidylglycerophosphate/cardiolipin synthase-like enzyme